MITILWKVSEKFRRLVFRENGDFVPSTGTGQYRNLPADTQDFIDFLWTSGISVQPFVHLKEFRFEYNHLLEKDMEIDSNELSIDQAVSCIDLMRSTYIKSKRQYEILRS